MSHDHSEKIDCGREAGHDRGWDSTSGQDLNDRGMPMTHTHRSPSRYDNNLIDDNVLNELCNLPNLEQYDPSDSFNEENEIPASPYYQRQQSEQSYRSKCRVLYSGTLHHPVSMGSRNQKSEETSKLEMQKKLSPAKQIEDYIEKAEMLRKELGTLKDQRNELRGEGSRSPSPETKRFLKENTKLQLEIQNKLKTINSMVDALNGITVEDRDSLKIQVSEEPNDQKCKSRSPPHKRFNYVYYDPEMHWCRVCDEFPPTAKDYLNHLHSPEHQKNAAQHVEAPWHSVAGNEGFPSYPTAPTKRTPIKGLQFFVPTTAWYCKLCDQFMGDLHCASAHIKSMVHTKNYMKFVEHNPHWETDWMSDRQKAFEKARGGNKLRPADDNTSCTVQYTAQTITFSKDVQTQRMKQSPSPQLEEKKKYKKKKRKKERSESVTSLSSLESESSKEKKAKKKKLKAIDVTDNKDLEEWMSSLQNRVNYREERHRETRSTSRDRERIREMQRRIRECENRFLGIHSYDREGSRDRRGDTRDWRPDRTDRRDRREDRLDPRGSRERQGEMRDRRVSRERRVTSRERRATSRERPGDGRERQFDTPATEPEMSIPLPPPGLVLPLPASLPAVLPAAPPAAPKPALPAAPPAVPTAPLQAAPPAMPPSVPAALPPPVLLPPAMQTQAPITPADLLSVPKEFTEALQIIFPTDPEKCNEMLQQRDLFNAMQQPSLLGLPPALGLPAFPPVGLLPPGGVFGFDLSPGPGIFSTPPLFNPHLTIIPKQQNNPRQNRSKRDFRNKSKNAKPVQTLNGAPRTENADDLMMLGIDASDVGAGI